jgi:hypothetical protein
LAKRRLKIATKRERAWMSSDCWLKSEADHDGGFERRARAQSR